MYMYISLQLPVAGQLEQALQRLRENSQAMEELRQRAKEREGELIRREKELSELRMSVARLQHGANEVKYCTFSNYCTALLYWIVMHTYM